MTTVNELITEVRGYLNEPSTTTTGDLFFSDTEIIGYLKRSINELCWDTDVNYRTYEHTVSGSDTSTITFLTLTGGVESELFDLKYILFHDKDWSTNTWQTLWVVTPLDNRNFVNSTDATLTCEIYDKQLNLNRDVNANDKIVISGRWKKTDISDGADTFPLESSSEAACVAYSVAFGMYKKQKMETGNQWRLEYESRKKEIQKRFQRMVRPNAPSGLSLVKKNDRRLFYFDATVDGV